MIWGVYVDVFLTTDLKVTKQIKSKNLVESESVFNVCCVTSLSTLVLPVNLIVIFLSPLLCVGVCCFLLTHYYDCSRTMAWSEVMLIASDQDNTVAYGRTNTMRGHFYTNKALPPPPPPWSDLLWMTEQGQYWHRKPEELNQNKNDHTQVFCALSTDLLVSYSLQIVK